MTRRITLLLTTAFLIGLQAIAADYDHELNVESFNINMNAVGLPMKTRENMAQALSKGYGSISKKDTLLGKKTIALATLVNPSCQNLTAVKERIKRGIPIQEDPNWTKEKLAGALNSIAKKLQYSKSIDAVTLAGFCFSLAADLSPNDDSILAMSAQYDAKYAPVDWKAVLCPKSEINNDLFGFNDPKRLHFLPGEQPNTPETTSVFKRKQAKISGLVVMDIGGRYSGRTLDILSTVYPYHIPNTTHFEIATQIGKDMNISFDEALNLVRMRHTRLETAKSIRFSFSDKYIPKDGGSAGLAFSLLCFSLLDDLNIDQDVAVTGDVTVDWKVRKVGGICAKINGAMKSNKKYVIIPNENAKDIEDMLLLRGLKNILNIQILAVDNVGEAVEFVRTDRTEKVQLQLDRFSKLQKDYAGAKLEEYIKSTRFRKAVCEISRTLPHHLSARYLAKIGTGWYPKTLSRSASLNELLLILYPHQQQIMSSYPSYPQGPQMEDELVLNTMIQSIELHAITHEQLKPLVEATIEYAFILSSFKEIESKKNGGNYAELLASNKKRLQRSDKKTYPQGLRGVKIKFDYHQERSVAMNQMRVAIKSVKTELEKLSINKDFIEAMLQ